MDIVISEFMDERAIEECFGRYEILFDPELFADRPRLLSVIGSCRALVVRNRTQVNTQLLDAASCLTVVGRLGVGLDNIDMKTCGRRGIRVCPATGANDLSVAEYVVTAALMLLRGAWLSTTQVAAGQWPRQALIGHEASGKYIGLIGFGATARMVAAKCGALGIRTIAYDPYIDADDQAWALTERASFDEVLTRSDVVSLHTPLTRETRHLMDRAALRRMKPGASLINAARGGVVDETALVEVLLAGHLRGAAVDVFEDEPLTADASAKFVGVPNLLLTPHVAGVTIESNYRVSTMVAEAVAKVL